VFQAPFLGLLRSNGFKFVNIAMTGLTLVHMVNGKAKEEWDYPDMLGFMQQLGVTLPK
jgi:hypothetical protein